MIILDDSENAPRDRTESAGSAFPRQVTIPDLALPDVSRMIRRIILEQSNRAHVGHIGSALSIADIIAALYFDVLNISDPSDPQRDRFVLSKGHAALALYAALHLRGWLPQSELDSFCSDGTLLGVHPERWLVGIDFCSGSLGHGLATGAGAALAARMRGSSRRTFVLMSDAECNEGSIWEAAMFAAHRHLDNLTAIVDLNGQQAFGYTRDVIDLSPMAVRWEAFGWDVYDIDGHDPNVLAGVIGSAPRSGRPRAVLAHTTFGKGVSFMEGQIKWHYLPMSSEEYAIATREVGGA